jgi:hypothetical protein
MKGWSIGKTKFLKPVIKSIENHSEACLNRNPKLLLKVSFLTLSESQTSNKNAQILTILVLLSSLSVPRCLQPRRQSRALSQ